MTKIILTGSRGFLGRYFLEHFLKDTKEGSPPDVSVVALIATAYNPSHKVSYPAGLHKALSLSDKPETLQKTLSGADFFFHFAGRAHRGGNFEEFKESNVDLALRMAQMAVDYEVAHFVHISSVAVYGERTTSAPFGIATPPHPQTPYGLSKLRAEEELTTFFKDKKTNLIIIRPPLVYASDAPGNIGLLRSLLQKGVPAPFGSIENKRAVLHINDFVCLCGEIIEGKHIKREDGGPSLVLPVSYHLSTGEIYEMLAKDLEIQGKSFKTPAFLFKTMMKLPIIRQKLDKIASDFQVLPNWEPKFPVKEA